MLRIFFPRKVKSGRTLTKKKLNYKIDHCLTLKHKLQPVRRTPVIKRKLTYIELVDNERKQRWDEKRNEMKNVLKIFTKEIQLLVKEKRLIGQYRGKMVFCSKQTIKIKIRFFLIQRTFNNSNKNGLAAHKTILWAGKLRPPAASVQSTKSPWHRNNCTAETSEVP